MILYTKVLIYISDIYIKNSARQGHEIFWIITEIALENNFPGFKNGLKRSKFSRLRRGSKIKGLNSFIPNLS